MMERHEKIEFFAYKLCGVLIFKKLTLLLEKFIHRKDGEKNINYHPKMLTALELREFLKYYYYNGKIHVRNAIGLVIVITWQCLFKTNVFFVVLSSLFLVKDLYCIMLQRYNFIRTKCLVDALEKKEQKKIEKYANAFISNELQISEINFETIKAFKGFLIGENDFVVDKNNHDDLKAFENFQKKFDEMKV